MSLFTLYTNDKLNTTTLDHYTYTQIKKLGLSYPLYNKIVLAEVKNTYHEQAQLFKSRLIKDYSFKNVNEAGKVPDFLTGSVYDVFDNNISFLEYLEIQLFHDAIYYQFIDELGMLGKEIVKIFPLSPKYVFTDKEKKEYWQIVPNTDQAAFLAEEPATKENNTDYSDNLQHYTRYDIDSKDDNRVFVFSGRGSRSDYYPNIPYLEALQSIETNRLIGVYDQKWLQNGSNFKNILELVGLNPTNDIDKEIIDRYKRDLNSISRSGEIYIIANPTGEQPLRFMNPQQVQKENFNETRNINRDEILAANGLNPTIMGIKTNESSLTSTSQAEAIKLYLETQASNKIKLLQYHYDRLFSMIDPNYNTNIIFETITYEDAKQVVEIETQEIANENLLIGRGNLQEFNEYRLKRGKRTVEQAEFDDMVRNLTQFGFEDEPNAN